MIASPGCFYTGGSDRAILWASLERPLFSSGFTGCERAQNAVQLKGALGVERGLAQQPLQILQHRFLIAGARLARPTAALIGPLTDFFGCGLEHVRASQVVSGTVKAGPSKCRPRTSVARAARASSAV